MEFLFYMLRRMNFCNKWIGWVKGCLISTRVSVLINGSPSEKFDVGKGLHQGDPLAPFLFLVVVEGLNGLLQRAIQTHNFSGYRVGGTRELVISMLQFADDTIFFGEASVWNAQTLKCILRCFELVSGLRVNFHKSKLVGIAVDDRVTIQLAHLLNCKVMFVPFVYLGLTVGAVLIEHLFGSQ